MGKLVDADKLYAAFLSDPMGGLNYDCILREVKPVNAVQVVRCRECTHAHMTMDGLCKYCDVWFPDDAVYVDGDYYCASGERKDGGNG